MEKDLFFLRPLDARAKLPASEFTHSFLIHTVATHRAQQSGLPTGDPKKLDIDVILAAQALTLGIPDTDLIIATSNIGHISRFVPAALWTNITL